MVGFGAAALAAQPFASFAGEAPSPYAAGPLPPVREPADAGEPLQVTTDTPEYCDRLADRVASLRLKQTSTAAAPVEADALAADGQHLCDIGHVRGGIARLRRALLLLRRSEE